MSTGLAIGSTGRVARACSCDLRPEAEYVDTAAVVFAGTLTEVTPTDRRRVAARRSVAMLFAVDEVFKGDVPALQHVVTSRDNASCGLGYPPLGDYIVYASPNGDLGGEPHQRTSSCSGTAPWGGSTVPAGLSHPAPPDHDRFADDGAPARCSAAGDPTDNPADDLAGRRTSR